jgi:uncharacterized protein with PIN domain
MSRPRRRTRRRSSRPPGRDASCSRDTHLWARLALNGRPHLFIEHERIEDQLRQVDALVGLGCHRPLTRCSRCNTPLESRSPVELHGGVWPHVARTHECLGRCAECGRIYWRSGQVDRMAAFVRRVLGRDLLGTG